MASSCINNKHHMDIINLNKSKLKLIKEQRIAFISYLVKKEHRDVQCIIDLQELFDLGIDLDLYGM